MIYKGIEIKIESAEDNTVNHTEEDRKWMIDNNGVSVSVVDTKTDKSFGKICKLEDLGFCVRAAQYKIDEFVGSDDSLIQSSIHPSTK